MHDFIFKNGIWIGEGSISFSAANDKIKFYTRWTSLSDSDEDFLKWTQEVEIAGTDEKTTNHFHFILLSEDTFSISLSNDLIGKAMGKGLVDSKKIAWELKNPDSFQGFEVYDLQDNGDYILHAEYAAADNFRTIIDSKIWKKS